MRSPDDVLTSVLCGERFNVLREYQLFFIFSIERRVFFAKCLNCIKF